MHRLNNKKLMIVVGILLLLILAGVGFLFLSKDPEPEKMIDVIGLNKISVKEKLEDYELIFKEEFSETVEKGKVISTYPKKGEYIVGKITIVISLGKEEIKESIFTFPDNILKMTLEEIEELAKKENFAIKKEEIESELAKGSIVKIFPEKEIKEGDTLTIYIAKEKKKPVKNETPKEPSKPKTYYVSEDLLNISESEFIKHIKGLGLIPQKANYRNYSTTIKQGNIYAYDDGNFNAGATVNYVLSDGPYSFNADSYNGKTKDEVKKYVDELNDKNAHVSIKFTDVENNDNVGKTFDCSVSKDGIHSNVSCKIGIKKIEQKPVEPEKPTPSPEPTPKPDKPTPEPEKPVPSPKPEKPVEPEVIKAYIPSQMIFDSMVYSTADEAVSFLQSNTLSKFKNVTYKKEKTRDYSVGCVYKVEVDGNSAYEPGEYDINTPITVYVSLGY